MTCPHQPNHFPRNLSLITAKFKTFQSASSATTSRRLMLRYSFNICVSITFTRNLFFMVMGQHSEPHAAVQWITVRWNIDFSRHGIISSHRILHNPHHSAHAVLVRSLTSPRPPICLRHSSPDKLVSFRNGSSAITELFVWESNFIHSASAELYTNGCIIA